MGIYNVLLADFILPNRGKTSETDIQFRTGWLDLNRYRVSDELIWKRSGIHEPRRRPEDGNLDGKGAANCSECRSDYWAIVAVRNNVISPVELDQLT